MAYSISTNQGNGFTDSTIVIRRVIPFLTVPTVQYGLVQDITLNTYVRVGATNFSNPIKVVVFKNFKNQTNWNTLSSRDAYYNSTSTNNFTVSNYTNVATDILYSYDLTLSVANTGNQAVSLLLPKAGLTDYGKKTENWAGTIYFGIVYDVDTYSTGLYFGNYSSSTVHSMTIEYLLGTMNYYSAGTWNKSLVYYYDGTSFVQCIPRYYDGSKWIQVV